MRVTSFVREAAKARLQTPFFLKGLPQNGRHVGNRAVQLYFLGLSTFLGGHALYYHFFGTIDYFPKILPSTNNEHSPLSKMSHDVDAAVKAYKEAKAK